MACLCTCAYKLQTLQIIGDRTGSERCGAAVRLDGDSSHTATHTETVLRLAWTTIQLMKHVIEHRALTLILMGEQKSEKGRGVQQTL